MPEINKNNFSKLCEERRVIKQRVKRSDIRTGIYEKLEVSDYLWF